MEYFVTASNLSCACAEYASICAEAHHGQHTLHVHVCPAGMS